MIDKLKMLAQRLKKALCVLFILHVVVGFVLIVILAFLPPLVIGPGKFDLLVQTVESLDFKWWLVVAAILSWLLPILLVIIYSQASFAKNEVDQLHALFTRALDRAIPIEVDLDSRVPVKFDEALRVPVTMSTTVDIDDEVELEALVPIRTEIPFNSEIETRILGPFKTKVPIRATIPLDFVLPIRSRVHVKAKGVPIELAEEVSVSLPQIEVPITGRLETKIDLLANLRQAESIAERLLKKL